MAIQTSILFGRELTSDELTTMRAERAVRVAEGLTDGLPGDTASTTTPVVRTWTTLEAANAWISFCNGFTPPPVSATVTSS
jgi:hypothetical protein